MFQRFSESARQSVVSAQEHARLLGHQYIGSEHLLLGVLDVLTGDQLTAHATAVTNALGAAGITVATVSVAAGELADPHAPGSADAGSSAAIPFTSEAKKVLELSLREAIEHGDDSIGARHILLAVIRQADGTGARILEQLGGPLGDLRQRITDAATDKIGISMGLRGGTVTRRRLEGPELPWVPRLRRVLVSVDHRLANLERHLGIAAEAEPDGKLPELIGSVEKRLTDLESHFGLAEAAEAAGATEADEGPAEGGEPPAAP